MTKKEHFFIEDFRTLSIEEVNLIQWLLTTNKKDTFISQIEKTKVITKCTCGCKTIDLQVEEYENQPFNLVLSAQAFSSESIPVDVILHIKNGLLAELEIYAMDGSKEFSFPKVENFNLM